MQKIFLIASTVTILSLFACEKVINEKMTVAKDYTGIYLRFNNNDYHVCNTEKLTSFQNGDTVIATFKKIKDCTGSEKGKIICMMYHENEGWIEIEKIN